MWPLLLVDGTVSMLVVSHPEAEATMKLINISTNSYSNQWRSYFHHSVNDFYLYVMNFNLIIGFNIVFLTFQLTRYANGSAVNCKYKLISYS
jgi:hypothetical protein